MNIQQQVAETRKRLAELQAKLSDEDRAEIAARDELAKAEQELQDERERQMILDLDRRMEKAKESLGPDAMIRAVAIKNYPDTFIVQKSVKAHKKFNQATRDRQEGKGGRAADLDLAYAVAVVYDWNGIVADELDSEFGVKLQKYLTDNPGLITPITNAAIELMGVFAAERKS